MSDPFTEKYGNQQTSSKKNGKQNAQPNAPAQQAQNVPQTTAQPNVGPSQPKQEPSPGQSAQQALTPNTAHLSQVPHPQNMPQQAPQMQRPAQQQQQQQTFPGAGVQGRDAAAPYLQQAPVQQMVTPPAPVMVAPAMSAAPAAIAHRDVSDFIVRQFRTSYSLGQAVALIAPHGQTVAAGREELENRLRDITEAHRLLEQEMSMLTEDLEAAD